MATINPAVREAVGDYQWGFHDDEKPLFRAENGLSEDIVRQISGLKKEPEWMLEFRLDSLRRRVRVLERLRDSREDRGASPPVPGHVTTRTNMRK